MHRQLDIDYQNPEFPPVTSTGDKWERDYILRKRRFIDHVNSYVSKACNLSILPICTHFAVLLAAVRAWSGASGGVFQQESWLDGGREKRSIVRCPKTVLNFGSIGRPLAKQLGTFIQTPRFLRQIAGGMIAAVIAYGVFRVKSDDVELDVLSVTPYEAPHVKFPSRAAMQTGTREVIKYTAQRLAATESNSFVSNDNYSSPSATIKNHH